MNRVEQAPDNVVIALCQGSDRAHSAVVDLVDAGFGERQIRVSCQDVYPLPLLVRIHVCLGACAGLIIGATLPLLEHLGMLARPFNLDSSLGAVANGVLGAGVQMAMSTLIGAVIGILVILTLWPRESAAADGPPRRYVVRVAATDASDARRASSILSEWAESY